MSNLEHINVTELSYEDLSTLANQAQEQLAARRNQVVLDLRKHLKEDCEASGVSIDEVIRPFAQRIMVGESGKAKGKSPVAPKYQNPENTDETWSGRGRRPKWFLAALESGYEEKDLLI